jgi:hypothetical protein
MIQTPKRPAFGNEIDAADIAEVCHEANKAWCEVNGVTPKLGNGIAPLKVSSLRSSILTHQTALNTMLGQPTRSAPVGYTVQ